MIFKLKYGLSAFMLACILFTGCKGKDEPVIEPGVEVKDMMYLHGNVNSSIDYLPVGGVTVLIGDKEIGKTDGNGDFTFSTDKIENTKVVFKKNGYYNGEYEVELSKIASNSKTVIFNVLLFPEAKKIAVDPTQANMIEHQSEHNGMAVSLAIPANVLPSDVKEVTLISAIPKAADAFGVLYMMPIGTQLSTPIDVKMHSGLPDNITFDDVTLVDNAASKTYVTRGITNDNGEYVFSISTFSHYVLKSPVTVDTKKDLVETKPYQVITVDNACGANSAYAWKPTVKVKKGFEIMTNLETEVAKKFAGVSNPQLLADEIKKNIQAWMQSGSGIFEYEVELAEVSIKPMSVLTLKTYPVYQQSTISFKFNYKGTKVDFSAEVRVYTGMNYDYLPTSCDDHSGGGHSGGGTL